MEFKLVYGRSGTGKSTYIYEDIKNKMKDNKIFVIVSLKIQIYSQVLYM